MLIPRSIACAAVAVATTVAVALPAQAGLAAPAALPTDGLIVGRLVAVTLPLPARPSVVGSEARTAAAADDRAAAAPASSGGAQARTASPLQAARAGQVDDSFDDDDDEADDSSDDVQVVDGTDAPEDDSDILADDSSSSSGSGSGSAARRDKTSGKWAQIARPTAVRARMTAASRAVVTWRSSVGGVLAQRFVVELRAGRSVLRTTTFSSARSAAFWSLSPAKRYSVTVTAVAADGTRKLATGAAIRTPAAVKSGKASASSAKAAARHAKAVSLG